MAMPFPTGGSCLLQSPSSPAPLLLPSALGFQSMRKRTRKQVTMASLNHVNQNGGSFLKRRAFLLVGLSALPLMEFRARAVENLVKEKQVVNTTESPQTSETLQEISLPLENKTENQEVQQEASENPFVALLNELGIIGSGVLGALYMLTQKEKTAIESTVQTMKAKLNEKEAAMVLLEKNCETRLLNEQEERIKQIRKCKEEQISVSNQLASANSTIMSLRQELQINTKSIQDFKGHIDRLQIGFAQAMQDKKMLESKLEEKQDNIYVLQEKINLLGSEVKEKTDSLENLNISLTEKEMECKNLASIFNQTKETLAEANSKVEALNKELLETRKESDVRNRSIGDLSMKIKMVVAEKDDVSNKLNALEESYDHLKSSSTKQATSDSKLLSEKGEEIKQLKGLIELASHEANENRVLIRNLMEQRDNLNVLLEKEVHNVKNLKGELETVRETLKASRLEAVDLAEKLKQSKQSCDNLNSEVSRIETNFAQVEKSLKTSLDEAELNQRVLSDELLSVKEVLKKTKEELSAISNELKSAALTRENLKKELVEIYKKAESTTEDLKEERKVVASLNRELEASRKQILENEEARRYLEVDLEEATQSLREMNKNALSLSKELEISNSRIRSLELEKDLLYKSHIEQKSVAIEAQENAEDAHNIITRLGNEREKLVKRAKKLEEEMASAKGEILRLRREINSSSGSAKEYQVENAEAEGGTSSITKKNTRRRKGGPTIQVSQ